MIVPEWKGTLELMCDTSDFVASVVLGEKETSFLETNIMLVVQLMLHSRTTPREGDASSGVCVLQIQTISNCH